MKYVLIFCLLFGHNLDRFQVINYAVYETEDECKAAMENPLVIEEYKLYERHCIGVKK
jgi:hypothetical protein